MEESYLRACAGYVALNPVRTGLAKKPEGWRWSSAAAHLKGQDDLLVKTRSLLKMVNTSWKKFLTLDVQESEIEVFRKHERTGRPMGLDRKLKYQKPGPKKR